MTLAGGVAAVSAAVWGRRGRGLGRAHVPAARAGKLGASQTCTEDSRWCSALLPRDDATTVTGPGVEGERAAVRTAIARRRQ